MTALEKRYLDAKRALFHSYYGARLNAEQTRAVCTAEGPLLILAGAGSGKTTVLVTRIAHLIKYGTGYESDACPSDLTEEYVEDMENAVLYSREEIECILPEFAERPCPPWQILAITFTNKAARELRERLSLSFDDASVTDAIVSGTFHSVCLRILRKYGERVDLRPGFTIYDTDDKKRLVVSALKDLGIDEKFLPHKTVASEISRAKDNLKTPKQVFDEARDLREEHIARAYELYERRLTESNAVDFDSIIMKTVELLRDHEDVREYYQRKFRYVSVDEYQDTNYAQFCLTELLSGGYRNIMAVGDDDQSIYKFRGATIENILNFDITYPDATVIKLEQNYRSTKNILAAANAVIANNSGRHEKSLWCTAEEGEKIVVYTAPSPEDEARFIIDTIAAAKKGEGGSYRDFAILYRLNELSRTLETAFAKSGLPYRVLGGQRFYDRKEIRDMTAYLSLIVNHDDTQRLLRIVNEPKRKIGDATMEAVEAIAAAEHTSAFRVMARADMYPVLQRTATRLLSFTKLIEDLSDLSALPSTLLRRVFDETGYREMLVAGGEAEAERISNVEEYVNAAVEYERRLAERGELPTLFGFLEEVALVSDVDKYDETADAVVLMTVHSAKGLEFPTVFVAGMEESIFPSSRSFGETEELEEERRLAYVAFTRAKKRLYITHTKLRRLYGMTKCNPPSRFIAQEIPEDLLDKREPKPILSEDRAFLRAHTDRASYRYSGSSAYRVETGKPFSASSVEKRGAQSSASSGTRAVPLVLRVIPPEARVSHAIFGQGTILSARPVGGDVLYEIRFDSGETKRLMATYAKLKEI